MLCSRRGYVCCSCSPSIGGTTLTPPADEGQLQKAFRTLQLLDRKGLPVSRDIIYSLLQECIKHKNFITGAAVHTLIVCRGLDLTACFCDHLIRLFASCGSLSEANHVFESVTNPTTHTWNGIISAHVNLGHHERAFSLYKKMLQDGAVSQDRVTFSCILRACSASGAIWQGRVIHEHVLEENLDNDVVVMITVMDMYSKTDSIEDAHVVFNAIQDPNLLSWGAIISGYSEQGNGVCALELFEMMQYKGLQPSRGIFLSALKACNIIRDGLSGRRIHDQIIRLSFEQDSAIQSTLVDMYAKCGSLGEAYAIFRESQNIDVVMWGAMISGFAENGQGQGAFEAFKRMQETDVKPNKAVFISLLKACSKEKDLKQGILIHEEIRKADLDSEMAIEASLIDMYSNCGSLEKARTVFEKALDRDYVIWVAIIAAYIQHGYTDCALALYGNMIVQNRRLDAKTFVSLLKVCNNGASRLLWLVHDNIVRGGCQSDVVLGSALVDTYGKCGFVEEARRVFDLLPERNVISWGGMLAGYVQQGLEASALILFHTMLDHGIKPDRATISCMVSACCGAGNIKQGREIHDLVIRNKYELDVAIISSLVDLYAKCGSLHEACKVFNHAAGKDEVLWGVIIASCCLHGNLSCAFQYLKDMEEQGLRPINAIFTSMLTACCHAGNLEEGLHIFKVMTEEYGIMPDREHCSCMIDLLSRTGGLTDAQNLFQSIPHKSDFIMGTSLLTGCQTYCNLEIGNQCFKKAF